MTSAYFELLAPECVLLIGGAVVLLLGQARGQTLRRYVPVVALAALVIATSFTWQYGSDHVGRELPGLRIDTLVVFVRLITLATGVLLLLINWHRPQEEERGEFFGMLLFSTVGLTLTTAATDLLVLFFAIELVSVPLYVLVALSSNDTRATEAAFKYFFLGALAAALMVYGFSFLYGAAGTTALLSPDSSAPTIARYVLLNGAGTGMMTVGLVLAFGGLAFKMTAVPFHFYAPDVYQGAASSVTAVLGFLPKAAGLLATAKLFQVLGWRLDPPMFWLWWAIAALTMTAGNVLALLQSNVKRLLAYSGIAHTGYMLIGLLVGPAAAAGSHALQDGLAAVLFYLTIYAIMNAGAFAVLAYLTARGRDAENLEDIAGLARTEPVAALVMVICLFSLMGMPITAGFWGKVYLFSGALSADAAGPYYAGFIALAVIGVLNSAVAAAYYLRVIANCTVGEMVHAPKAVQCGFLRLGLAVCAVFVLGFGIWPRELLRVSRLASEGLTVAQAQPDGSVASAADDPDGDNDVPGKSPALGAPVESSPLAARAPVMYDTGSIYLPQAYTVRPLAGKERNW